MKLRFWRITFWTTLLLTLALAAIEVRTHFAWDFLRLTRNTRSCIASTVSDYVCFTYTTHADFFPGQSALMHDWQPRDPELGPNAHLFISYFSLTPKQYTFLSGAPLANSSGHWLGVGWKTYDDGPLTEHTVYLPLPYLYLPLALASLLAQIRLRRICGLAVANRCPTCNYDLRATPDRCPECGREKTNTL